MGKYEPSEKGMVEKNLRLLNNDMYSESDKAYLVSIMPKIVLIMQNINNKDDDLVYDCLFHAVCLKQLSAVRG